MAEVARPAPLDAAFVRALGSLKRDLVCVNTAEADAPATEIAQLGVAEIDAADFAGWPELASVESVIETYIATEESVAATSTNEPFISAWQPLAEWMDQTVRSAMAAHDLALDGPAYLTASLTNTEELEGTAHADDDLFVPDDQVGIVAIIAQLEGPRVATGSLPHGPVRPMSQVSFTSDQRQSFSNNELDHIACSADQLVIFAQFGQLHAGPAAPHVKHLGEQRQLLVYRAIAGS